MSILWWASAGILLAAAVGGWLGHRVWSRKRTDARLAEQSRAGVLVDAAWVSGEGAEWQSATWVDGELWVTREKDAAPSRHRPNPARERRVHPNSEREVVAFFAKQGRPVGEAFTIS